MTVLSKVPTGNFTHNQRVNQKWLRKNNDFYATAHKQVLTSLYLKAILCRTNLYFKLILKILTYYIKQNIFSLHRFYNHFYCKTSVSYTCCNVHSYYNFNITLIFTVYIIFIDLITNMLILESGNGNVDLEKNNESKLNRNEK